jgi:two-component system, sensor histidine kinase PdtaS
MREAFSGLRILFVEDRPEDAEIAIRELRRSGLDFESTRVDTGEDFMAALSAFSPSIVVSDYSMPRFDGMKALRLSLEWNSAIPFIILTGSKNEETAVICLKSGASDYVIKSHMSRLPFAVREALEHARVSREREASSRALRESEQNYRTLADSGQALIWTSGVDRLCNYFNRTWLEFTGRSYEEERGNGWTEGVHPEDLERCIDTFIAVFDRREKFSLVYRLRRFDGQYRWIQDDGCPRYGPDGEFLGYIGHCLDITERKLAEESVKSALREKETLLRELFHRTRNNMQVIMAILAIEEGAANDRLVSAVVRKTSDRIMSMSLVHKKLYESQDLSFVDLKSYSEELVELLSQDQSFPGDRVRVETSVDSVSVTIDAAVPCGLVLHELLSNAFEHAFPGTGSGRVRLAISRSLDGLIEIEVSDNGVGLPEGFDYRGRGSLGFQLIHGLVEEQLKGSLSFESSRGLSCRISFPDARAVKRI